MSSISVGSIWRDCLTDCSGAGGKYVWGGFVLEGLKTKKGYKIDTKSDSSNITCMVVGSLDQ